MPKTSELTGAALDWAVAKCEGECYQAEVEYDVIGGRYEPHCYSTDWAQGGPIIEHEEINLTSTPYSEGLWWFARIADTEAAGATPLIAAMRCFVARELGDEVDVPKELL